MRILALDCGGTKSRALLVGDGQLISEYDLPPLNAQSHGPDAVAHLLVTACQKATSVQGVVLSLAGFRTKQDRELVLQALGQAGFDLPVMLFPDALAALRAGGHHVGVALIAGTGSSAYARGTGGAEARAGGWGHRLGDEGSGYWLGREALSAVVRAHDSGSIGCSRLEQEVLAHYGVTQVDDLRSLTGRQNAVAEIAGLVPVLGRLLGDNDPVARDIVVRGAEELGRLVRLVAGRVSLPRPHPVVLAGGVPRSLTGLYELVADALGSDFAVAPLDTDPAWGAYWLAAESGSWIRPTASPSLPVTEQENPASAGFSQLTTLEQAARMNAEDANVIPAVARALPHIARLVDGVAARLASGGRLIYVGAGTSGRLALLDAAETVPTFGIPPGQIVALIAGGRDAVERAVEGAEDDERAAEHDFLALGPTPRDAVVGVTASGRTRYVHRALAAARQEGCLTGVVVCNAESPGVRLADLAVVVEPGPEIIAGSTRLKAGTAQKLVLNMISTLTMVQLGRTFGTKMIGVRPTNAKLRERSVRLVRDLTSSSAREAEAALERAAWDVPLAALTLHLGSVEAAYRALTESGTDIGGALRRAGLRPA